MNDPCVSPNLSPSADEPAPRPAVEPCPERGDSVDAMLRQWAERRPGVDVSSSEVLARLEQDGWIVRTASPDDRRRSLVSLTARGREEFDRRLEDHLAVERELLSVLDSRERLVVVGALRKLLLVLEASE
ncbi:MarR family transcriptional regulator [Streptomyces sp. KPB2]|nr:MarR family transcriptional regulator [Streptomyces sp. KPB2]MBH5129842.1 winged helix DNA-binding protein [Streptomyces sp. HB-N217]QKW65320.1 winged helix DNA-binding protein [Streptomyces sp. NA03103]